MEGLSGTEVLSSPSAGGSGLWRNLFALVLFHSKFTTSSGIMGVSKHQASSQASCMVLDGAEALPGATKHPA